MGIGMEFLKWMSDTELLPKKGRLLDIGESCLLEASPADVKYILGRHGGTVGGPELDKLADELSYRSTLYGHDSIPTLFLGDVLTRTAVEYVSFDIVSARYAEVFDLNQHSLAKAQRNSFDLVINHGTTEHLMNQYNSFKVIHEACKVGGHMFHQLPSTGYINHGYFCYNALLFKELAEANGYDLVDLWFYGPNGDATIIAKNGEFPGVTDGTKLRNNVNALRHAVVTNANINVLLRKTKDAEYRVGLEVKTAAGDLNPDRVYTSVYIDRPAAVPAPAPVAAVAPPAPASEPTPAPASEPTPAPVAALHPPAPPRRGLAYRAARKLYRMSGLKRAG